VSLLLFVDPLACEDERGEVADPVTASDGQQFVSRALNPLGAMGRTGTA
jgi:hypothetical protein